MIANRIPAGWFRDFAFMGWPCFRSSRWKHTRREAERSIRRLTEPVIFASDRDPDSCKALSRAVRENDLSGTVSVVSKDFFDLSPTDTGGPAGNESKGMIVINPPYGRRMHTREKSEKMFVEICTKLKTDFKGWRFALIAPGRHLVKKVPFRAKSFDFFHGGLRLTLLAGRIS
jgi:putative N6-adenine-specific DNA methylase